MTKLETWQQTLAQSRQQLLDLLQGLSLDQWQATVFHDDQPWTVATIVNHLIESEKGMSIQVHKIRKGEPTIPDGFDLNRYNADVAQRIVALSPQEYFAKLEATRSKTLAVMTSLGENEWSLQGKHPSRGLITIEQYYETIAIHERMHADDIRKVTG